MRVTSVDLVMDEIKPINIGLRQPPDTDKYLAKSFFGLDAQEIIPKFYGKGLSTGRKFYDFASSKREIVMRIVLNPNYVLNERASDLRDDLYRSISANRNGEVKVVLRNGATSIAQIFGMITKFEVAHFSKVQELQLTILCRDDAIFRSITDVELDAGDLGSAIPYEITDGLSTCPHGMFMEFEVHSTVDTIYIQDKETDPDWKFELVFPLDFLDNDIIQISSNHNDKYVKLIRGGSELAIANSVSAGSLWPMMFPRTNTYYTNPIGEITLNEFSYKPAYWGI